MENKIFQSIDGLFKESLKYFKVKNIENINYKKEYQLLEKETQYPHCLLKKVLH